MTCDGIAKEFWLSIANKFWYHDNKTDKGEEENHIKHDKML